MELSLRYRGLLPAAGTDKRVREKHAIRQELSSQIESYCEQSHRLKRLIADVGKLQTPKREKDQFDVERPLSDGSKFWWRWPLCGYNFVPLVTQVLEAHVELRMRLYRKNVGILFQGGDLDNRLKTFFDALQVPKEESQVPKGERVSSKEAEWLPIFCLLDNDNLITKLSIESFKLLMKVPKEFEGAPNYVELDLDVVIHPITPMTGTVDMLFKG